jgi:hypothetical protein
MYFIIIVEDSLTGLPSVSRDEDAWTAIREMGTLPQSV